MVIVVLTLLSPEHGPSHFPCACISSHQSLRHLQPHNNLCTFKTTFLAAPTYSLLSKSIYACMRLSVLTVKRCGYSDPVRHIPCTCQMIPLHDSDVRTSNRQYDICSYMFSMLFIHMYVSIASQLFFSTLRFQASTQSTFDRIHH
jgi:hypothetical protein